MFVVLAILSVLALANGQYYAYSYRTLTANSGAPYAQRGGRSGRSLSGEIEERAALGAGVLGATVGVAKVTSCPGFSDPTSLSTESRSDMLDPGSVAQQTVSQVPVVSTHVRPVAVAIGHGHIGHAHGH